MRSQEDLTAAWDPIREADGGPLSGERLEYYDAILSLNRPGASLRYVLAPCGRRSLKTLLPLRALVLALPQVKDWSNPRYFFAGPTRDQTKNISWDYLKALTPKFWVKRVYESDLCIETTWGAELWVLGLDRPERIEGRSWDGGVITERANVKAGCLYANILPALADRSGWLVEEGTPDYAAPSASEYKERCHLERGDTKVFHWSSETVLSKDKVDALKEALPPILARQELGGSWEDAPGRAYHEFVRSLHVRDCQFDRNKPLIVSCDFNFGHHNWGLYQYESGTELKGEFQSGVYKIFDEVYEAETNVAGMLKVLRDRVKILNPVQIVFYGDYSGEQKKAEATTSAWKQIKAEFPKDGNPRCEYEYKVQPPISDRLERVNGAFKNGIGQIGVIVHPKCKNHIRDFEEVARSMLFSDNKTGLLTHASDAFGYYVYEHERKTKRGTIDVIALSKRFE